MIRNVRRGAGRVASATGTIAMKKTIDRGMSLAKRLPMRLVRDRRPGGLYAWTCSTQTANSPLYPVLVERCPYGACVAGAGRRIARTHGVMNLGFRKTSIA